MAHHVVTLNYSPDGFRPDKEPLLVKDADTFSFQLGTAPPNSRFKITLADAHLFSAVEAADSGTKITVLKAANSSYRCQLFAADGSLLSSVGQPGGHVRPG